ncbi:MAG: hypothetical protein HYX25_02030 [Candidatus Solibacter usitatus]|nr:hypothetical protein [Candidatus Solibacter usitatus]
MSVWPSVQPTDASLALSGREGELLSISVDVAARDLEDLLEALALLDFPINPQIFHDAAVVYVFADGSESETATTLVEFPAYGGNVRKIREVLASCGFSDRLHVNSMLEDMHSESCKESAPPGSAYQYRWLRKHPRRAPAGAH